MLNRVDDFLLTKVERFSHWCQRTVGLNHYHWRVVFWVATGANVIMTRGALGMALMLFLLVARAVDYWLEVDPRPGTANIRKITEKESRIGWLTIMLLFFIPDVFIFPQRDYSAELFTFLLYFDAIDDLPPGESRVRQFLRSLRPAPQMQPVEA